MMRIKKIKNLIVLLKTLIKVVDYFIFQKKKLLTWFCFKRKNKQFSNENSSLHFVSLLQQYYLLVWLHFRVCLKTIPALKTYTSL